MGKMFEEFFFQEGLIYCIGYAFSIIGGLIFIGLIVDAIQDIIMKAEEEKSKEDTESFNGREIDKKYYGSLKYIYGPIEEIIYTSAVLLNFTNVIGIILLFKVASRWALKHRTSVGDYYSFVIGSTLSLLYGVVGAKMIQWFICRRYVEAISIPIFLIVFSLIIFGFLKLYGVKSETMRQV